MSQINKILILVVVATSLSVFYTNCSGFSATGVTSGDQSSLGSVVTSPTPFPIVGDYDKSIPSNFKVSDWIVPYGGAACDIDKDNTNAPDVVGAFRFLCNPSHNLYDDPVVYPGRPGASHLHTFFGNTMANAHSTYESLRTTGQGTCEGGPLNRSAYWIPAMMNGKGKVVMPDYVSIYYKRRPKKDQYCQVQGKECVGIPRGLRFVFGYNMGLAADDPKQEPAHWKCENGFAAGGVVEHDTIAGADCPSSTHIGAGFSGPDCWDGVHLDTPDHRSHVTYGSYGNWGYNKCPATHPYVIPAFTIYAWYPHNGTADLANWYLSSDRMPGKPQLKSGSSFHSDWFGAWDDDVMKTWHDNAIDRFLNCSDGQLGDGTGMMRPPGYMTHLNQLVDPPAMSVGQKAINDAAMADMMKEMKMDDMNRGLAR